MRKLEVIVDYNDADYITNYFNITDEDLLYFAPLFKAISSNNSWHNWPQEYHEEEGTLKEMYPDLPDEMIERFDEEFIPSAGDSWGWVHTIKSIKLLEVDIIEDYLKITS